MRKTLIFGTAIVMLMACTDVNTNGEKTITQDGDTISNVEISVSKVDALANLLEEDESNEESELLFKAHGSEPGWLADVYNNKLRLVLNYGKDSLWVDDTFKGLDAVTGYSFAKAWSINGQNVAVSLSISNTSCTGTNGNKEERTVSLKVNNVEYKGCGSFIK